MKSTRIFLKLLIVLIFAGCAENENNSFDELAIPSYETAQQEKSSMDESDDITTNRKLIKKGNVEYKTDDISKTRKLIFESVKKHKGYISYEDEHKSTGRLSNTFEIRVPAENFDQLLQDATEDVSNFDSKNIEVKDVTEEFLDIEARLKTKKELENRYLEILKKAVDVKEILQVEEQIGNLRSEIESIEGRLRYLKSRISLSTLKITIYETKTTTNQFGNKFSDGFKNGWDNLVWFFVYLINIWPFILIALLVLLGVKGLKRGKK
ncbi:DUF4349 domain-containing protein [Brumimicrobium mesophilum]|uniref:DUF4349 domain-containing protein n=1 Tax=Brumimicrobium mesophilum TaxID=392717 RepID=UPI00131AE486|nr:DUF4349 domain-containing protein [Brumimicrobium mesophilum]